MSGVSDCICVSNEIVPAEAKRVFADAESKFSNAAKVLYWILDIGYWILDIGYWILDIGYWILDIGYRISDSTNDSIGISNQSSIPRTSQRIGMQFTHNSAVLISFVSLLTCHIWSFGRSIPSSTSGVGHQICCCQFVGVNFQMRRGQNDV